MPGCRCNIEDREEVILYERKNDSNDKVLIVHITRYQFQTEDFDINNLSFKSRLVALQNDNVHKNDIS